MKWELTNACVVTPKKIVYPGNVEIENDIIKSVSSAPPRSSMNLQVNLQGLLVFPGLINSHDHLLGTYFPRVGDRKPYLNWLMWDNDLKSSPIYAERQQVESIDLYTMGGFRHLITGVTSVQDHMPHFVRELFKENVPIRLIDRYAVAHSVGSFALPWGEGIEEESRIAVENNIPFIVHCSEGFDEETRRSVEALEQKNALNDHTVLIHGIAFSDQDIAILRKNRVNVVWCPVSNLYMFGATTQIKKLLDQGINVVLGTDSPMSGSVNIFEEIFVAKSYYKNTYSEDISDRLLLEMVTTKAAQTMCLPDRGSIEVGKMADLLVVNGSKSNPYGSFTQMGFEDIMLVMIGGRPVYADGIFIDLFETLDIPYHKVKIASCKKIIEGDILGFLERIRESLSFHKEFPFLPVEPW